ncbi:UNVERIFIED_CONTAM: hypothetical protein K2H54_028516 [Gekko kuhli]
MSCQLFRASSKPTSPILTSNEPPELSHTNAISHPQSLAAREGMQLASSVPTTFLDNTYEHYEKESAKIHILTHHSSIPAFLFCYPSRRSSSASCLQTSLAQTPSPLVPAPTLSRQVHVRNHIFD